VAEHVIALMLALAKRMLPFDAATRKNEWEIRNSYSAFDLDGKTLGILGMGRIGMLVCQKATAAFNMEILAYDPLVPKETMEKAGARVAAISEIKAVDVTARPSMRDEGDDRNGAVQDDEAFGIPHQLRPRTHRG
jgi:phosphoglycerate dehydrogenase-like enzyme